MESVINEISEKCKKQLKAFARLLFIHNNFIENFIYRCL